MYIYYNTFKFGGITIYRKYIKLKFASVGILLMLLCNLSPAVESIKFSFFSFENNIPYEPNNPYPTNGSTNIPINTTLNWTGGDPDGDPVTYDVYFGTTSPPPQVVSNQTATNYNPGTLLYETQYYWKIIAWDNQSANTEGPIWNFTTEQLNQPPYEPNNPYPTNESINISIYTNLNWTGGDPDGNPVTYDVYLGTNTTPPIVSTNQTQNYYQPSTLNFNTTYYWIIIAWDNYSTSTTGPLWNFTTEINNPPYEPNNPYPTNGSTNIPINTTLNWTGGDPDEDPVTYDVYLDTNTTPILVSSNQTENFYQPITLDFNTTYYWIIIAWDNYSTSTTGPLWNFTTEINNPPYEPNNPKPENGTTNVDINSNIKWDGGDPDGDTVTYDIYFSNIYPPQQIASNYTSTTYDPGTMEYNTTYYWKIVAWDSFGVSTEGPEWYFTTSDNSNRPPNRPIIEGILGLLVPNRPYEYNFTSMDPDNDDVFYYIDWGDGTSVDWTGPYFSGEIININHTWPPKTKIYQIKAKVKDIYNSESDWGTFFVFVLSPRNSGSSLFVRIIQRFPIFQRILMVISR
jgi:hypothetical protein